MKIHGCAYRGDIAGVKRELSHGVSDDIFFPPRQCCLNQCFVDSMYVNPWIVQPSLNFPLNTLCEYASTRHIRYPFGQIDATRVHYGYH